MYQEFTKELTSLCEKYNLEVLSPPTVKQSAPLAPSEEVFNQKQEPENPKVMDSTMLEINFTCVKHFVWEDTSGKMPE